MTLCGPSGRYASLYRSNRRKYCNTSSPRLRFEENLQKQQQSRLSIGRCGRNGCSTHPPDDDFWNSPNQLFSLSLYEASWRLAEASKVKSVRSITGPIQLCHEPSLKLFNTVKGSDHVHACLHGELYVRFLAEMTKATSRMMTIRQTASNTPSTIATISSTWSPVSSVVINVTHTTSFKC